jgi:putative oxidoreductase
VFTCRRFVPLPRLQTQKGFFLTMNLPKMDVTHGMALLRIVTGFLLAYHGLEVFSTEKMNMYLGWDSIKNLPIAKLMLYVGKGGELAAGIALILGFLTRPASLLLAAIMLFITFYIGHGKFWYEDQHPFVLAILALVFAIYGPGAWALDNKISKK